jgi:hypothetical protein
MQLVSGDSFGDLTEFQTEGDLPVLLPEKIIKFFDDPADSGFYTYYQASYYQAAGGEHARQGNALTATNPEYTGSNTFVIDDETVAGTPYDGETGIDTYVIRHNLDKPVTIRDTGSGGVNDKIVFDNDVSFRGAANGPQLLVTLSTGAVITIEDQMSFDYTVDGMENISLSAFLMAII